MLTSHFHLDLDFKVMVRQAHPRFLPGEHMHAISTNQKSVKGYHPYRPLTMTTFQGHIKVTVNHLL